MAHWSLRRVILVLGCGIICFASRGVVGQQGTPLAPKTESVATSPAAGLTPPAVPATPNIELDPLSDANRHYRRGEFDAAIKGFNSILQQNPKSPDAYAGLTRVYLKQKDPDQAFETAQKGLTATASPTLQVALGEVLFRRGKITEAEREWVNVVNLGYPSARAYWGLSRVRTALSLYAQSQNMLDKARELDSTDPDIQKYWMGSLSRAEQIKFWEDYLASPTNDDAEARADIQHHLEYLRATLNQPPHPCRLVSQIPSAEETLQPILRDPTHLRGFGLTVLVNEAKSKLLVDTGASGILIDQGVARKAGIVRVSETNVGGVGDKSRDDGFVGFANSIKIGDIEFQDCRVRVVEKRSVLGDDGLIGADMFNHYLVDLDFPKQKLRLTPLPARPTENNPDPKVPGVEENLTSGASIPSSDLPPNRPSASVRRRPRDRYIAPEMQSYTQIYRFGHSLLVPTTMEDRTVRLFLIDTGSTSNLLSTRTAREITKIHNSPQIHVQGLSGEVDKVYLADKALLQFGHLRQDNQAVATFDLSHLSDNTGTEISGILGMTTLHMLDIRIDYRDGIVDFKYNP